LYRLTQPKDYSQEKVLDGAIVGILLNMWNGELSFTLDGVSLGIASKDKRLRTG